MRTTSWTLTHPRRTIWLRPTQPFQKRKPLHQPKECSKEKLKRLESEKKRWNRQLKWPRETMTKQSSLASRRPLTTWCESKEQLMLRISILGSTNLSLLTWVTKVRQQEVHRPQRRPLSMLPMWGKWLKTWTTCPSGLMKKTGTTSTFQWASLSLASSKLNLETPTTGSHLTINPKISPHCNKQSSRTRQTRGLSEAQATISTRRPRRRTMRDLSMQQANTICHRFHLMRLI